jgi:hypothetical protein
MTEMRSEDIRIIVAETLAEQQRLHHNDIDAAVLKTIATILTSFGIDEEDRTELRADFQHLRRWRKSVEQAQSYTFKAVITVIVTATPLRKFLRLVVGCLAGWYRARFPWPAN